jgi:hypothetical protein
MPVGDPLRAVVLVEGLSDRAALEALAERRGLDLAAAGVEIVPIGGAQAIGRALAHYGPAGRNLGLGGLCDAGESTDFARGLERAGLGVGLAPGDLPGLGFFVCVDDLEDELIRAHGPEGVVRVVESRGDLRAFRTMQKQPEWRDRALADQLRRFMGSGGRRKVRYGRYLVDALDDERVPPPLERVLAHAMAEARRDRGGSR